ncbi:hypothetical protein MMC22_010437 [Lobaria immixta]|nr:hypothetical protein [Lobaria immixta]
MDRLVQIAAQEWLELHNETFRWRREALFILANLFPSGSYDTWGACEALSPHVQVVLEHELQPHDCAMKRAELLQKLAWLDRSQGNYKNASSKAQEAWEICKSLQGKDAPMVLSKMTTVADCLIEQDKLKEAENILQICRTLQEKTLGSNHLDTLMSMNNLSVVLVEQRSLDEAEELCTASWKLRLQLRGPDHPDVLESQENFADILRCRGNYEDAERHLRLALRSRRRVLGDGHPSTLGSMHQLATYVGHQGKRDEAIQLYRLALSSEERAPGSEHMETCVTRLNLALELEEIGNFEEAAQHLRIILDSRASFTEASLNKLMVRAEEELRFIEEPQ